MTSGSSETGFQRHETPVRGSRIRWACTGASRPMAGAQAGTFCRAVVDLEAPLTQGCRECAGCVECIDDNLPGDSSRERGTHERGGDLVVFGNDRSYLVEEPTPPAETVVADAIRDVDDVAIIWRRFNAHSSSWPRVRPVSLSCSMTIFRSLAVSRCARTA